MDNRFLFSAIFSLASGIALYFSLPFSPAASFPILICALSLACFIKYKNIVFLFVFGFFYAAVRADMTGTKLLRHSRRGADVAGVVERVDYTAKGQRVFLRTDEDFLFRISMPAEPACAAGEELSLRANLYAPSGADAFNNFDYARWSFFNGMSGSGTAISGACAGAPDGSPRSRLHFAAGSMLADALALGYKSAIPRADGDRVRASGISHVFSISGFHMTLFGGWLFVVFLFIAKLFPKWTRRHPARNLALPLTAAGLFGYLILSGADVATIRAFVMAAIAFLAVMTDRRVLTLRSGAIVFCLMILINPFWLVSAGFQLSFAAIFGLLAFFDSRKAPGGKVRRFFYYIFMSSLIATVWTFPFVAYHFGNFPIYGLVGNLVLLPVFSFGIMPCVFAGIPAALLGWRGPFIAADYLYARVMDFADAIAGLPLAMVEVADIPPFCLFLVFSGMFFFLTERRRLAAAMLAASLLYWAAQPAPVLKTTADGEIVGFRQDGREYFNTGYSENHPFVIPRKPPRAGCRRGVCEYRTENWTAVSVQKFLPLRKNLSRLCDFDFIISYLPLDLPACPEKVVRGSVRIFRDGRVEQVADRTYRLR